MASLARISQSVASRVLPPAAIVIEDARQAVRHWALLAWLVLSLVLALVWLTGPVGAPRQSSEPTASAPAASAFAARVLRWHLLWAGGLAIALAASALPAEAKVAGEAILSRGISRRQYYLAKCAARMLLVAVAVVVAAAPAIGIGSLRFTNDLSAAGAGKALLATAAVLSLVSAVAFAGGVWFQSALAAVAVMWMTMYGFGIAAAVLELPRLSPMTFADGLADLLRGQGPVAPHHLLPFVALAAAFASLLSLGFFSRKDV